MKSAFAHIVLSTCFLMVAAGAYAQNAAVKIGVVDYNVIMQQMPEFKDIQAQLQVTQKKYEDTLRMMQAEFQEKVDAYQKQQGLMSAEAKAAEEAKLSSMRDNFLQYQQATLGQDGAYAQLQKQLVEPVRKKVQDAINKVAKDEKLTVVMETTVLAYFDSKLDITYNVLAYLRRGDK